MPTIVNPPGQITPILPAAGGDAAPAATAAAGQAAPIRASGGGATIAYMTATGAKQGQIKGDVTDRGREGAIALLSLAQEIDAPFDLATGKLSGKRQHRPITVTKRLDPATPGLLQALVTNEVLTSVVVTFYRADPQGREIAYFVVKLTNASLTSVALATSDDTAETEKIQMVYQKISWENPPAGKATMDDWAIQS